jgi:hypothetical protein
MSDKKILAIPWNQIPWNQIPIVIKKETIIQELGWTLEKYQAYQESLRRDLLQAVPDFSDKFYPEELILRWVPSQWANADHRIANFWNIVLTDKRIIYKWEEKQAGILRDWHSTAQLLSSHLYQEIVEVTPERKGDPGANMKSGGEFAYGWAWQGTGSTWGKQSDARPVEHKIDFYVTVKDQKGAWTRFAFRNIPDQDGIDSAMDFINKLNRLVELARKNSGVAT